MTINNCTRWSLSDEAYDNIMAKMRTYLNPDKSISINMEAAKMYWEKSNAPKIEKVIFNYPATIIIWSDKTKTVVKCRAVDTWDPEKGFVMAYLTKVMGKSDLHKLLKKYVRPQEELEEQYRNSIDFLKNPRKYLEEATEAFNKIMRCLEDK